MKYYFRLLSIPLSFFILFSSLHIGWEVLNLPPAEQLTEVFKALFDAYGLPIVFLSALVEGMLLVGGYFPGVFIIFISIILSNSVREAAVVLTVITAGLFIAHMCNYVLGKYGWYKLLVRFGLKNSVDDARARLLKRGPAVILTMYWLPSIAALTDTAAGIIRMPFKTFFTYSLISVVFWNIAIGVFVYLFKDIALSVASPGASGTAFIYVVIGIWMVILLVMDFFEKRKERANNSV